MSKYDEHKREAIREMGSSRDGNVVAASYELEFGNIRSDSALAAVALRLERGRPGSTETRSLRNAEHHLRAMQKLEATWVGEHKIPGVEAGPIRNVNTLHQRLMGEMVAAGASRQAATDIALVLAWEAAGRTLGDLLRLHPYAFESFGAAIRPLPKRTLAQWIDRANHLAKGGK